MNAILEKNYSKSKIESLYFELPFPLGIEMSEESKEVYFNKIAEKILKEYQLSEILNTFPYGGKILIHIDVSFDDRKFKRKKTSSDEIRYTEKEIYSDEIRPKEKDIPFYIQFLIFNHVFDLLKSLGLISPYCVIDCLTMSKIESSGLERLEVTIQDAS